MNQALTLPGIGDLVDGRFRIDRKLGEGGTSTVYEVSHVITDKKFAIKWLLPELALEDAAVDRFIHEARVGGKFAHPHAVQVYDICKASDSFYMLMELLEGESLQTRLEREGKLSVNEACSIILSCADVLSAAHRIGIIHRDLKPANIFLCSDGDNPEVTKLLDFGISTFCSDLQNMSLTATPRGSVIGTPLYMSPEQMLGADIDPRADIYALGAVLYELVSGVPPFQADNYGELVVKVTVEARPTPLEKIAPVDKQFASVVARAMARRASDRFSSVEELIFALRPYAASLDTSTVRAIGSTKREPSSPKLLTTPESEAALKAPRSKNLVGFALLASGFALAALTVASVGGHWFDESGHIVSASAPQPEPVAEHSIAIAPEGAQLPSGDSGWRPAGNDILTGQAAHDELPSPTHPARPAALNVSASTTHDKAHSKASARKHARLDEAHDVASTPVAATPAKPPPSADLQLHRGDFRPNVAAPAAPESLKAPKASVSRADF